MNRQFAGKEIKMTKKYEKMFNFIYNLKNAIVRCWTHIRLANF